MDRSHSDGGLAKFSPADVTEIDPDQIAEPRLNERPSSVIPMFLLTPNET